jgi:hypothetical protein
VEEEGVRQAIAQEDFRAGSSAKFNNPAPWGSEYFALGGYWNIKDREKVKGILERNAGIVRDRAAKAIGEGLPVEYGGSYYAKLAYVNDVWAGITIEEARHILEDRGRLEPLSFAQKYGVNTSNATQSPKR